jgi:peroxin-12
MRSLPAACCAIADWFCVLMPCAPQPPAPPLLPPDMPSPLRSPLQFALRLLQSSPYMAFEALKYALPLSIFAFKFLEWWYSPDNPRRRRGGSGGASGALSGENDSAPTLGAPKVLLPHPKGCLYVKDASWRAPGVATTRLPPVEDSEKRLAAQEGLLHNSCVLW